MIKKPALFLLWLSVWLLLSWPPDIKDVIFAAFVSSLVTFMTMDLMIPEDSKPGKQGPGPARAGWFLLYLLIFIWECLKANIDVAYRVVHPDLPISPGTIKVKIGLKSDIGLTFLANSITLTPGTTSVDIDKESGFLYVHVLSIPRGLKPGQAGVKVVDTFERILKRIFD